MSTVSADDEMAEPKEKRVSRLTAKSLLSRIALPMPAIAPLAFSPFQQIKLSSPQHYSPLFFGRTGYGISSSRNRFH